MIRTLFKSFFKILPLAIVLLVAGQLWATNELAGKGASVRELDQKIETIKDENALLTQQVASASSLLTIGEKAEQMGFVEPTKTSLLLVGDLPLALGQPR